ncbi:MAG TPA: hypothetical protein GYA07_02105 [Verrucomicrobia bacterium]|nr:hypothetical protein [Verrucomicrobiota bacterium]HOB33871.1 hypothetical protein [Verrucomicrobiota bacterium]HOP96046.1 hypothetical protein [Verrucomicrobiota bacterium]HPU57587.1 hypothetical protein [Verrucomicrobiota bacterium]
MRFRSRLAGWILAALFLGAFVAVTTFAAPGGQLRFKAVLVWATDAEESPNPNHKPADEEVRNALAHLPLKWKNYFVVTNVPITISSGGNTESTLSQHCKVSLKDIDGKHVEVGLIGKGQPVLKRTQPLPRGETLVLGGPAPESTAWLVLLKRVE